MLKQVPCAYAYSELDVSEGDEDKDFVVFCLYWYYSFFTGDFEVLAFSAT
jgi:hypothetical protein